MKIDFQSFDLEPFLIKDVTFCGISSKLIQPNHIGTKFDQKNKIFRSSIWSNDGELLSAGLPKFVNWGENPDNFPAPTTLKDCKILNKLDGSLCICDYVNETFSMRTRGTVSYESLHNSTDFLFCINKYPMILNWIKSNNNYSLLFEIVSPNQKIVIDYGDSPDFILVGAINKDDYSLMNQTELDLVGTLIGVVRPKYYSFNTIEEMLDIVKSLKDIEGFCVYSNGDQTIHKLKTDEYLKMHRFKSSANLETTVDLYFSLNQPSYDEFEKRLVEQFDFECFKLVQNHACEICDGMKEVANIIEGFKTFADKVKGLSRKDAAVLVIQAYGETNRASFVFNILDGKTLDKDKIKKILYQVLKK